MSTVGRLLEELRRDEVGRDARTVERVENDHVGKVRAHRSDARTPVDRSHLDPAVARERQLLTYQRRDPLVRLEDDLRGGRAGCAAT